MARRGKTIEEMSDHGDAPITAWIERLDRIQPEDLLAKQAAVLRCIYSTIVVVHDAPSGRRYEFAPGEVKGDVDPLDVEYLLSLAREQETCCGGGARSVHYFERA